MNASKPKAVWLVHLTVLLVLLPGAAADGVIGAQFRIDSPFFKDAFPADLIAQTEQAVAASLAQTAKSHFGFLDWQSTGEPSQAGPRLILRMIDIDGGACSAPPTIKLKWSAVVESTERALASVPEHGLYTTCEPNVPTQEPDRLVSDIIAAAKEMLLNEATRRVINKQLLALVPIASELVIHQNVMLLLPVHPMQLSADPDSELIARFQFAGASDQLLPSDIMLRPRSHFGDRIQLLITAINVPTVSVSLSAQGEVFPIVMPEVLAGSQDLRVYMINYIPSPFAGETVGDSGVVSDL